MCNTHRPRNIFFPKGRLRILFNHILGSSSVSQTHPISPYTGSTSNAGVEPKLAQVATAAAAVSGIRLTGASQSATASPQKGNAGSTLPGINSRSQSNSGWL